MDKENKNIQAFIAGVNNRDRHRWKELYDRYYVALCSYVSRMLNDDSPDVEDLVQDVFMAIWKNRHEFRNLNELTNYLYRACYNNTLIYIRNNHIHQSILDTLQDEHPLDESDEAYSLAVQEELIRQLHVHIQKLPSEQRRIMVLRIKGYSWNEIAELMNLSINTVKTQKQRSYKFLREHLSDISWALVILGNPCHLF